MPIKLNGTTIIDETNLADTNLSNLTAVGQNVISNIANSAVSSQGYMKHINTTSGTLYQCYRGHPITIPNNGWIICYNPNTSGIVFSMGSVSISIAGYTSLSFPVLANTYFSHEVQQTTTTGLQIYFYPEV